MCTVCRNGGDGLDFADIFASRFFLFFSLSIGRFHSVRASFNEHQPPYGMLVFNDRQRNGALAYPFNDPRNYKTSLVKGLENRWFDRVSNTRIVYDRRRSVLFEFDVYARARVL